ncbi:sporulation protein [Novosphingobium sp.]|uniref:sporulation protein n=1 Tax=Novosphingobium sp. TaxID=1874826 RepID=UPI0038B9CEBE
MKSAAKFALLIGGASFIALAGTASARPPEPVADIYGPTADYPIVIGDPYVAGGTSFTPSDTLNYDAVGYALAGEGAGVTGAHHTLPIPCYVEVTSLDSGRTALVRLDKRGPMDSPALIQLSPAALAQLGLDPATAHAPVRVRRVNPPEQERALLRTGQQAPARMDTPPGLLGALKRKLGVGPAQVPDDAVTAVLSPAPLPVKPSPQIVGHPVPTQLPAPRPVTPAPKAPVVKPKPAQPPAPAPHPNPATSGYGTSGSGTAKLAVQVAAFSARDRAEKVARALGGSVSASGKVFRVRISATGKPAAEAALAKAHRAGYADARIVSGD